MSPETEVHAFLLKHLQSIMENDTETYHATTSPDLTLYEWWVTPQRIDGLPFHDFMMAANQQRGAVFGEEADPTQKTSTHLDLANLHIQRYGNTAIASYTMMLSTALPEGVKVVTHNESRVMIKRQGQWQVVHVHKSPAWPAHHTQP